MALLLSSFFFFCSCFLFNGSLAQIKIPAKFDGFAYKDVDLKMEKSIMVEAFFDPLCPDSRDAWPPLKQALDHYSQVYLTVHPFPLPLVSFFSLFFIHGLFDFIFMPILSKFVEFFRLLSV